MSGAAPSTPVAPTDEAAAAALDPDVRAWFQATYPGFTPPQRHAVLHVHERRHTLISSPTGTGKTLSAFLAALSELVGLARRGELGDGVQVVYVSPLKALNNDIERNLTAPLAAIRARVHAEGRALPEVRVAVRTGDTPRNERAAMTRKPPHILITTPESLALLLNAPRFSQHLRRVRYVIVDEVHALAGNKRGAHLALSLERLEAMCDAPPVRVGLSATIAPLQEVARFVAGARPCEIVEAPSAKALDLQVVCPVPDLGRAGGSEVRAGVLRHLTAAIEAHRSVIVFTNTRAGTERIVHELKARFGEDAVGAHHGSMSRERRLQVESELKAGALRCVVTSTSLEMGIDVGHVDLVVLLGSPKSATRLLQRVGRSGHQMGGTSKGHLVALDRDDLIECVVLAEQARARALEPLRIPEAPLDVLCQHLVGMSLGGAWGVDEALALLTRSGPYRALSREDLLACLRYLSGGADGPGRLYLATDESAFGRRGRRMRPIYYMNVGVIPDASPALVMHGAEVVGTVEESFVENLQTGDLFVLAGMTWQFQGAHGYRAQVTPAPARRPTVPTWVSESMPLDPTAARAVEEYRGSIAPHSGLALRTTASNAPHVTESTICQYVAEQASIGPLPTRETLLIEELPGEDLRHQYVFHLVAGRRANEALARAFAQRLRETRGASVGVQASDTAFALVLPEEHALSDADLQGLFLVDLREALRRGLSGTELLKRRFRHVAERAFLLLRRYPGKAPLPGRHQVNAQFLLQALERSDPEHPVLRETYREVLEEALDVVGAEAALLRVLTRETRLAVVRHDTPSPFAFGLLSRGLDDALSAGTRSDAVRDLHARLQRRAPEGGGTHA